MNAYQQLIAPLTMLLSLLTATGVLMHDTNADKALVSAWNQPEVRTALQNDARPIKPGSMPHTHSDRMSFAETVREAGSNPRTTPRGNGRKHLWQKRIDRGQDTFDGYQLYTDGLWA